MGESHNEILQDAVESGLVSEREAEELLAAGMDENELLEQVFSPERLARANVQRIDEALENYAKLYSGESDSIAADDPLPVELLDGLPERYEVIRPLGSGGMGHVFEVIDRDLNRHLAMKVLPLRTSDPRFRESLEREGRVLADLKHPGIATLFHTLTLVPDRPCLIMEYVEGAPLDEYADTHELDASERIALLTQVARAVGAAHTAFKVHRDLKPHNILVGEDGAAKVIDFGIAGVIGDLTVVEDRPGAVDTSLTLREFGTFAYMSPEQVEGQPIDARSDVYALGLILYELLSGHLPYEERGENDSTTDLPSDSDAPLLVPLQDRVDRLETDLCAITAKCLARDRNDRYADADRLADDLDSFLSDRPVRAFVGIGGARYRLRKWLQRNRVLAGVGTTATMLLAITIVTAFFAVFQQWNRAIVARRLAEENAITAERERAEADAARREAELRRDDLESSMQRRSLERASRLIREGRFLQASIELQKMPRSRWGWECDRMGTLINGSPRPIEIIGTHDWGIADLLCSRDGATIITSGHDGRVITWDAATKEPMQLAPGSWSEHCRMWRHATRPLRSEPPDALAPDCFARLCWVEDERTVAGASLHGKVKLWDIKRGASELLFAHERPLYAVAALGNGQVLVAGDDEGTLLILNRASEEPYSLHLGGSAILDICPVGDDLVAVAQEDGTIGLVDLDQRKSVARVNETGPVWDLDYSRTAGLLAVGAGYGAVSTYLLDAGERALRKDRTHYLPSEESGAARNVHAVHVAPDGSAIYAGDDLGRVVAWDRKSEQVRFVYLDQGASMFAMIGGEVVETLPLPLRRRVAAISTLEDNKTLFTGGHDTTLKRWTLEASPAITTLDVETGATVAFDAGDATLLWSGGRDGTLSLWDTIDGRELDRASAHDDVIVSIAAVTDAPYVATCAANTIRFWRRRDAKIEPAGAPILHEKNLRSIALSPDGRRLAAYDVADQVSLWDVSSGRLLGRSSMKGAGAGNAASGIVAFNSDGTLLAAAGPGQATWLFHGNTLEVIERPPIAAGLGATALAWHPKKPRVLITGDSMGRVAGYPRDLPWVSSLGSVDDVLNHESISGVAFTRDGRRLAAATVNGRVVVEDPDWIGHTYLARSPHAAVAPLTQLAFDPTGRRLALVHDDGHVDIWETGDRHTAVSAPQTRTWSAKELMRVEYGDAFSYRHPSVQLDGRGRLHMLFTKRSSGTEGNQIIAVAHETDKGLQEEVLHDLGPLEVRGVLSLARSLALVTDEDHWYATVRRPLKAVGENSAELILLHGRLPSTTTASRAEQSVVTESMTGAGNHGFDTHLGLIGPTFEKPTALHYSHGAQYLEWTYWRDAQWHTQTLGRQGDGFKMRVAFGSDGRIHTVFSPTRFNGDPTPATYVAFDSSSGEELSRHVLDYACCSSFAYGIAVDRAGLPVMHYGKPGLDRTRALSAKRRTTDGWEESTIYRRLPGNVGLSNLVCMLDGSAAFARFLPEDHRLELVTSHGEKWTHELVWQLPASNQETADVIYEQAIVLRLDHLGRPVIIFAFRRGQVTTVVVSRLTD